MLQKKSLSTRDHGDAVSTGAIAPCKRTQAELVESTDIAIRQAKVMSGGEARERIDDWSASDMMGAMGLASSPVQLQAMVNHTQSVVASHAAAAQPVASDGAGQPLPQAIQAKMARSFGVDFSSVRVHEGTQAEAMGAAAYTQGTNLHFAPGQYNPGSLAGQELIGHELAHVVQQSQGRVSAPAQAKGLAVNADAGLESEADEQGSRAARGEFARDGGGARELTQEELKDLYPPGTVIPVALSAFASNVVQPAFTARRRLGRGSLPMIGPLYHEHIFFQDNGQPPNIGFMGEQGLGQDTAEGYSRIMTGLDDARMRQAVADVGDPGTYSLLTNNCQNYVASVLARYHILAVQNRGPQNNGGRQ